MRKQIRGPITPAPAPVMDKYILDNGKVVFQAHSPFPKCWLVSVKVEGMVELPEI